MLSSVEYKERSPLRQESQMAKESNEAGQLCRIEMKRVIKRTLNALNLKGPNGCRMEWS